MTILCALDKYFFTGSVTKFIYVTLFMCNIWWCKKYALTNRCRGCWVNTKQMLSLPCKCLIYCHDRCSRRMNSCLWCFTKIGMLIVKVHILWEGHINFKKNVMKNIGVSVYLFLKQKYVLTRFRIGFMIKIGFEIVGKIWIKSPCVSSKEIKH